MIKYVVADLKDMVDYLFIGQSQAVVGKHYIEKFASEYTGAEQVGAL